MTIYATASLPKSPAVIGRQHTKKVNRVYSVNIKQSKGPNMFKRMIKNLITWSMRDDMSHGEMVAQDCLESSRISATGMKFEVYRANGGTIVETRRHDRRSGDAIFELHIVTENEDLGQAIGRIITMEALKS